MELFRQHGLINEFTISYDKLRAFLTHIAMKYSTTVPFHNVIKATAVLHAMHFFLTHGGLRERLLPVQVLALVFVCCVQDVDHPGVTNSFVNAMRGNSEPESPTRGALESHHIAIAMAALQMPQLNFLGHVSAADMSEFERLVVDFMMVTDMRQHTGVIHQHRLLVLETERMREAGIPEEADECVALRQRESEVICHLAVVCADLGVHAMTPAIMQHSVRSLFEELHNQGDRERVQGLPLSPLCNREAFELIDATELLLTMVVRPTFECLADAIDTQSLHDIVAQVDANTENLEEIFATAPGGT